MGVRQRGGVKGKCKVFGLNNWESLESIPEAVGSHRKILRLGGRGRGQMPSSPRRQPGLGWIRALAQPPAHCGLPGTAKPSWTSTSPFYKEAARNKGPLKTFAAQRLLLPDSLTQLPRGQIYTYSLCKVRPLFLVLPEGLLAPLDRTQEFPALGAWGVTVTMAGNVC